MIAVIPQWSGAALAKVLTAPVDVTLTGIAPKQFQLRPNGTDVVAVEVGGSGASASIVGESFEAIAWLTGRADAAAATDLAGDVALAAAVLSSMRAV